jgi:predicted metal-dependent phosphoesterase TrpH
MFCDLHLHSTASDGTTPPEELPGLAREAHLAAIALTDHDTTAGLLPCAEACRAVDIEFVPGIELSVDPLALSHSAVQPSSTLHLLGLFVRHDDPGLLQIHERMCQSRSARNTAVVERLERLGVAIDYAEVQSLAARQGAAVVGRPHIAQVLINKGSVKTMGEAFGRYLGQGGSAYVRRNRLEPAQAIEAIHQAGGLAILAHPVQLNLSSEAALVDAVEQLVQLRLDGIETIHCNHSPADVIRLEKLARRFDLVTSGGSDYHGAGKGMDLGAQHVPIATYHALRAAWRRHAVP